MLVARQMWKLFICCLLQLYCVTAAPTAATATCKSAFFAIPTVTGASFPGGWAFVSSTSAVAYCKKKGFADAGAARSKALSAFGFKGRVAFNLATNKVCTAPVCGTLIAVECLPAGAKQCVADKHGNVGIGNNGKGNFGTNNKGRGNIGNNNTGSLNTGTDNGGESLTGYELQGYKLISKSLSSPDSTVGQGKPAPPAPGGKPTPPPPKNTPPGPDDGGDGTGDNTPPSPPPSPDTCPPPDNSSCPPCDCAPGGGLGIFDPNAPPSPSPKPSPPSNSTGDGTEDPNSCTNPCFKFDSASKTCSLSVCTDPCQDCFQLGTQTACLDIFGLNRFTTEAACKTGAGCDPKGKCLNCADGKWGCIATF